MESRRVIPSGCVAVALAGSLSLGAVLQAQDLPQWVDATAEAGITFVHSVGDNDMDNLIESNAAGVAFFDYDNDGYLDIYLLNGTYLEGFSNVRGRRNRDKLTNVLYRNNGDGTFTDVTEQAGVGDKGMGMAVAVADYDNDGDRDLFVSNYGPNVFYRNNGDGTFEDYTFQARLENDLSGIGSTFLDYDNDGYLDLYVGNYVAYDPEYDYFYAAQRFPGPMSYPGQPDVLYRNNGDGTFTDVTQQAGITGVGRAMGVSSGDYDSDGDFDIYVPNDGHENFLYQNNGDGTFTDVALASGTAYSQSGEATSAMSAEFADLDRDGFVDIVVPDLAYSCVYKNSGQGYFVEMSARMRLAAACGQYTSWSGNHFDFNHDGYGDLFISNGHPHRLAGQEDLLMLNVGGTHFENVSHLLGEDFQDKYVSRGTAAGDYDNDGDIDIIELNVNARARLLRNDGGNEKGNWLMVELVGTKSNRDAVGARVQATTGDVTQTRWRVSSSGYLSVSDHRLHFGLGDASSVDRLEIRWPNGQVQTLENVGANQLLRVTEP